MKYTTQQLWRNTFDEQFTDEMLAKLVCRAQHAIGRLESLTPWRDNLGVDDRVNTAVMKTLDGTRTWDPTRCELLDHLFQSIRSECSAEIEHAVNFPKVVLGDAKLRLASVEQETTEALESARTTTHEAAGGFFTVVIAELRQLAGKDKGVHKLLDMYDEGIFDRSEIMRRTNMSARRYGTIYQRLMRLAQQIDEELRDAVVDALAN